MPDSLVEQLPKIVAEGKKEAEQILEGLSSGSKITLQTNEYVLPSKEKSGLFKGQMRQDLKSEWHNRLIYGDNLLVMQALLAGDEKKGLPSMRGKIDLIYIDPPFDSKADYRTKINLAKINLEQKPTVIEQFAYADTWKHGTVSYLKMLYPRFVLMKELLSEKGSIFVHLDWHIGHYAKILLDDVFGRDNFVNEIIWWYKNKFQFSFSKHLPTETETIFWFSKSTSYVINHQKIPVEKARKQNKVTWDAVAKKMITVKDDQGNVVYYDSSEKMVGTCWEIPRINSMAKERLDFETQKPEALLERIINVATNPGAVVADFFAGTGTSGIVAERLKRRWILSDLGKPACMIMRKRLIDCEAKPFLNETIGDYQKEQFEQSEFRRISDLAHVVLNLYGAIPFNLPESTQGNIGYIKQGRTLIYVDSPSRLTGLNTLKKAQILRGSFMGGWDKVIVLGWNFVFDIGQAIVSLNDSKLEVLVIPPDLLDRLKTKISYDKLLKSGKIRFSSLQHLSIKPIKSKKADDDNQELTIELADYVLLSPDALPLSEEDREKVQNILKDDPLALIEYWSIDPDYDGEIFRSKWQDYRGNVESDGDPYNVVRKTTLIVPKKNKRKICVKAVDVFGFESAIAEEI